MHFFPSCHFAELVDLRTPINMKKENANGWYMYAVASANQNQTPEVKWKINC